MQTRKQVARQRQMSRRELLHLGGAAALGMAVAPARSVHGAEELSGPINVLAWDGYDNPDVLERFTAETGVRVNVKIHGGNAQGNDVLGAPALAGLNDWYLRSSYQSYLDGVRGSHPDDFYGAQMSRLAPAVADRDDIDDVIAFITTLAPRR